MNEKPLVIAICATSGRHTLLERAVGMFKVQDYAGPHILLIYNNSDVKQNLGAPEAWDDDEQAWLKIDGKNNGKEILLINNHLDHLTNKPYTNLGAIYRDALENAVSADIIIHWDDDDLYLPNHISEGVKGFLRAREQDKKAYKPQFSWYRHAGGIDLMSNNLEPSIFIDAQYLRGKGYKLTTTDQHYGWYEPLLQEEKLFVDPKGVPTLIYNWGDSTPTFKTSGNAGDPNNFSNYRNFSRDHGDRIIAPLPMGDLEVYYRQVEEAKNPLKSENVS